MKAAAEKRIDTIRYLHLLDGNGEVEFGDLVGLVAEICEVPYAAVGVFTEDTYHLLATKGLPKRPVPKSNAFCAIVLDGQKPLEISDTVQDARARQSPMVTGELGVRFYYGHPLVMADGEVIGALCVMDRQPKKLTDIQISAVATLSRQVVTHFERRRAEIVLNQQRTAIASSAKLSALGEMAAGIAHEINNPLAAIVSRAGFLMERVESGKLDGMEIMSAAAAIESTSLRISKTVKALRSFARDADTDPMGEAHVSNLFDDALLLCEERLRHSSIQFDVAAFADDPVVVCRPVQIVQVLLNLLNNAYDAAVESDEKWVKLDYRLAGKECEISVANGGPRLPSSMLETVIKPFYTTKPAGKGTGLGLSISQRILHAHDSGLRLDPDSPRTRFYFRLRLA